MSFCRNVVFAVALLTARKRILLVFPLALIVLLAIFPHAFHDRLDSIVNTGFSSNVARIEMARSSASPRASRM